jgi:hypothetical protein
VVNDIKWELTQFSVFTGANQAGHIVRFIRQTDLTWTHFEHNEVSGAAVTIGRGELLAVAGENLGNVCRLVYSRKVESEEKSVPDPGQLVRQTKQAKDAHELACQLYDQKRKALGAPKRRMSKVTRDNRASTPHDCSTVLLLFGQWLVQLEQAEAKESPQSI